MLYSNKLDLAVNKLVMSVIVKMADIGHIVTGSDVSSSDPRFSSTSATLSRVATYRCLIRVSHPHRPHCHMSPTSIPQLCVIQFYVNKAIYATLVISGRTATCHVLVISRRAATCHVLVITVMKCRRNKVHCRFLHKINTSSSYSWGENVKYNSVDNNYALLDLYTLLQL